VAARQRGQTIEQRLKIDLAALQSAQEQQRAARDQEAKVRQSLVENLQKLSSLQADGKAIRVQFDPVISDMRAELAAMHGQAPDLVESIKKSLLATEATLSAAARQELRRFATVWDRLPPASSRGLNRSPQPNPHFTWPVEHLVITQSFGPSSYGFEPPYGRYAHFHTGIDLAAPPEAPVAAPADGVVTEVRGDPSGYGTYVVLRHDTRITTLYAHLSLALVHVGDAIVQGQSIGLVGSTGNSTGPHIHFEVRIDDTPVDPAPFMG
jgi:murein DD-endopeptidase MepM/ murein hydrolase activator NlpD